MSVIASSAKLLPQNAEFNAEMELFIHALNTCVLYQIIIHDVESDGMV